VLLAVSPAGAERRTLELTKVPSCVVDGARVAVPVDTAEGRAALLQAGPGTIDFHLRLPEEAELSFGLAADHPLESLEISVAHDGGVAPLALQLAGTRWRADLADLAGRAVRIRFESGAAGPVRWIEPWVIGRGDTPVLLPAPSTRQDRRPNILLYVVDALRPDRLSLYGYGRPTSPRLEALAQRATVFDNAYSNGADTMSAIPALFTSLPPGEGLMELRHPRFPRRPTLAETLDKHHYTTAAFQANFTLRPSLGFDRGFFRYALLADETGSKLRKISAAALHAQVIPYATAPRKRPFFLYVQSLDVHNPYAPPPPFLGRWSKDTGVAASLQPDRYDEAIAYADHELGVLLDALAKRGLIDSTLIVVTADHGEALGEGGRTLHGRSLHEEQVRIPLLVAPPGQARATRVDALVSLMDLAPTLVDAAGFPVPPSFQGRSLLERNPWFEPRLALGEFSGPNRRAWYLREDEWKLVVVQGEHHLFHLPTDPGEERDLAAERPITTAYLARLLWERVADYRDMRLDAPAPLVDGLDGAERKALEDALRALGYIE
jgi:arylsulfatase A-like enzyme